MTTNFKDLRVAIIGAGPAGTTLARLLQLKGVQYVKVYEREASSSARSQGGSLDLHPESGQAALKACGLFKEFEKFARYEDQGMKILDKNGKCHFDEGGAGAGILGSFMKESRPEIDRKHLRDILLNSLEEGSVIWNKAFVSGTKSQRPNDKDDHQHTLYFSDGSTDVVDYVVGADGAWSKCRNLLQDVKDLQPVFSGIKFFEVDITKPTPETLAMLGNAGLTFILGDGKGIIVSRMSNYYKVYLALPVDDYKSSESLTKEKISEHFQGWFDGALNVIRVSDDEITERGIYAMPIDASWSSQSGCTLIGDSAHLMSPFAGEGVNLAMADALDLSHSLEKAFLKKKVNESTSLVLLRATTDFERKMKKRARSAAVESADNMERIFSINAAQKFARLMRIFTWTTSPLVWSTVVTVVVAGVVYLRRRR